MLTPYVLDHAVNFFAKFFALFFELSKKNQRFKFC